MPAPVKKLEMACAHCGSDRSVPLWAGREHEYRGTTDDRFQFVRCETCGLVRLNPRPDVSELARIYPPDYYAYNLLGGDDSAPSVSDRLKRRMYQGRIEAMVRRLGGRGRVRLLDVGCADGRLLDWYRRSAVGARLETHGIELDPSAAATARGRGHRVVTGRFEVDTELERESFDLILAFHVIEHVDDPERFARRAAELLAPGGLLVVATPNWDSADARRFAGHWGGNHWPRHWTLYDEDTMGALAAGVGLHSERIEFQPNPIFWVWTCHSWLAGRSAGRRLADRLFPPVGIFGGSIQALLLQVAFTVVDLALRAATGRTASMAVELRKPASAGGT